MLTYDDNQKTTKAHCRLVFSVQPQYTQQHRYYSTKVGQFNYFFVPFCIFYIPHNYVIPQAVPHAIPQTHSFKILVFIVRKGFFFCLEYPESLFSCQLCLKRKESTIFNFSYQNHGLKMPIVRLF